MPHRDFFAFCTSLRLVELRAIGALSQVRHYAEGAEVYAAGDSSHGFFIINRGAAESVWGKSQPGMIATVLSRGDVFGEVGALMQLRRDHSVRASTQLSVQYFDRSNFGELVRRVPSFFYFISEKLAQQLFQMKELAKSRNQALELSGNLEQFDVVTIYQTVIQSRQTGLLTISDAAGKVIAELFFEKGAPRWGRFDHLTGEEAFWQLFLHELHGTFAFSNVARTQAHQAQAGPVRGNADEMLIHAIEMRDRMEEVNKRLTDRNATLHRKQLNLVWDNPELESLRPVAEQIWQVAYARPISLANLYRACSYCELKIRQVVDEMLRSGLFTLGSLVAQRELIAG